jgi:heat-inducible transcriptional repressor
MDKLSSRQELILSTIIKEHIKTGTPVGSSILVEKYKLNISPATVRNEMAELEKGGMIIQPHTSAGRVPTEKAYRYYLQNIDRGDMAKPAKKISENTVKEVEVILTANGEDNFREMAKYMSQATGNAIFWAFHRHNVYYTGLSQLFQQPEFEQMDLIYDISEVIDRIDEIVNKIFDDIDPGVHALIGRENPFGNFCSTVMAKYKTGDQPGLFGILGPMRMNYEKNLSLANLILSKIDHNR